MDLAAGRWDAAVSASGAVLAAAFAKKGSPPPRNPYRVPGGEAKPVADPTMRKVKEAMFAEGMKQFAAKVARANAGSGGGRPGR